MDKEQQQMAEELLFTGEEKPSFAKMLYCGELDSDRIFPFPIPDEEEIRNVEIFIKELQTFCEENVDPDWIDRNVTIPDEVIAGLGRMGMLGITSPIELGGKGFSHYGFCRGMETIARRCGSTALFVNVQHSIGVKAIDMFGSEEQKRELLPKMITGEYISSFSLTEPNAGSDAAGIETRAVYNKEKDVWVLNGRKQWTTNGSLASVLMVMAKTEIETEEGMKDKVTAFIVRSDMPGFSVLNPALEKVGMRGTRTANLCFENVEIPASNVLGKLGQGLRICLTTLDFGRTTFGATCLGTSKECYDRALAHSKNRIQFKRPLASFTMVKKKLADMAALNYAMEATTYLTAGLLDRGEEDFMLETAILKVFNSEASWQVIYDAMQIFGGRSFFTDQPFERMMRDARLNMIGEGSNEVLRVFIGLVGMRDTGLMLKAVSETGKNAWDGVSALWGLGKRGMKQFRLARVPVQSKHLQEEGKELARQVQKLGKSVMSCLVTYKEEIMDKQLVLNRIAEAVMAIYTGSAVLSKLDMDLFNAGDDASRLSADMATAKYYLHMAAKKVDQNLDGLHDKTDDEIENLSQMLTGVE